MTLPGKLAEFVSRNAQNRGFDIYHSDSVILTQIGENIITADVHDRERFEVVLRCQAGAVTYRCTCVYYQEQLDPCKHVWATVLEAEHESLLQKWDSKRPVEFNPDEIEQELPEARDAAGSDDGGVREARQNAPEFPSPDSGTGRTAAPRPRAQTERAPAAALWRQQLKRIRSSMEYGSAPSVEAPTAREFLYVIDAETSLATGCVALEIHGRERKKNGEWGKPRPMGISLHATPGLPDPQDREIQSHLLGIPRAANPTASYNSAIRFQVPGAVASMLLPAICRTGRCRLLPQLGSGNLLSLCWDEGEPWEFWLEVRPDLPNAVYRVGGSLRRGAERIDLSEPAVLFEDGIFITPRLIGRYRNFDSFPWIALLRKERTSIPAGQKEGWLKELLGLPFLPHLDLPDEMSYQTVTLQPKPVLRIRTNSYGGGWQYPEALLFFSYDGKLVPFGTPGAAVPQAGKRLRVFRDRPAEQTARQQMLEAGFRQRKSIGGKIQWEIAPLLLPGAARELMSKGWQVESEGKAFRQPGAMKMEVRSGIDWFELHGEVEFGGVKAQLPDLLAASRRGEKMVRLGDGSYGMLPEEWLVRFGRLAGLGSSEEDHVRFDRCQVSVLDALLASQPEVECDALFIKAREELLSFERIEPVDPPTGFSGRLRPYQRDGLGWFHFLRRFGFGGCLADDMGLGKTVQVLALLEERRQLREQLTAARPKSSLVVVPRSLVFNWKQEVERFAPGLKILDHTGSDRTKGSGHFEDYDVVLTTYGTLRRDALHFKEARFDYVILDEAQSIKNADTESAKAARLLHGDYRLALSGTPIENHLGELWSLFEFLNPGMLGRSSVFRMPERELAKPDLETRQLLSGALRPFILRRTKGQVAPELPPKIEKTLYCELEETQRWLYNELRDHYRSSLLGIIERDGLAKSKIHVLEALLRLRQAACHPGLIDLRRVAESSAKLDMLLPQLEEVLDEGHKALVFSQFTSLLAIVRARLDSAGITYEYLDGQTRDRAQPVERFQKDPGCMLFLISLKAGGLGLNLTAAEYVYLLDPWWNPAVEAQAIDRTHRIGQTRPVFAYRIIAKDTVEEKVLELQKNKRDLADAIISEDNSLIRDLRREDLELLLS